MEKEMPRKIASLDFREMTIWMQPPSSEDKRGAVAATAAEGVLRAQTEKATECGESKNGRKVPPAIWKFQV